MKRYSLNSVSRFLLPLILSCTGKLGYANEMLPRWDIASLQNAPKTYPAPEVLVDGVQSIYFEGLPYQGKPTKVFAFYGIPRSSENKKVPGIVLIHGGGGTAFANWVKLWVSKGYAAIAIDHGGHIPQGEVNIWMPSPEPGPNMGSMEQIDLPTDDQWMYHAVADTMLAYSFLSSLPEVDPERIGITGISWGGVVASIVAGLDERPKFIIPVYGCGYISYDFHDGTLFLNSSYPAEKIRHWRKLWDPANYLEQAKAPMFWLTGSNDFAFTLKALQLSYQQAPSPRTLCVKIGMTHGHEGPAQESREIFAFADSIITASPPLTKIVRQGAERSLAWVLYEAKSPITRAVLNYTNDQGRWQDKQWKTIPAKINEAEAKVEADIPTTAKAYFFNLIDDQGLSTSTEHVLVNPTAQ